MRAEKKARLEAERATVEADTAERVSQFLISLFEESDPELSRGESVSMRDLLDKGAEELHRELEGEPLVRARLPSAIGLVYTRIGLLDESLPYLDEALEIQLDSLGEEPVDTATTLVHLGHWYPMAGRKKEALDYLTRGLAV